MARITEKTILSAAIKASPSAVKGLNAYGMGCQSCGGVAHETVAWAAMVHGVDLAALLKKMNAHAQREGETGEMK